MEEDLQHLRLLSIFQYVVGGIIGLSGCLPIIGLVFPIGLVGAMASDGQGEAAVVGWMLICMFVFVMCFN